MVRITPSQARIRLEYQVAPKCGKHFEAGPKHCILKESAMAEIQPTLAPALEPLKACARCQRDLPRAEFTADSRMSSGLKSYCRGCCKEDARERLAKDRDRINARVREYRRRTYTPESGRARHLLQVYGLTVAAYNQMLVAQGGRCAICRTDQPGGKGDWHVDHCHTTGINRGLLCSNCNVGLGMFQDDAAILSAAINYLAPYTEEATA